MFTRWRADVPTTVTCVIVIHIFSAHNEVKIKKIYIIKNETYEDDLIIDVLCREGIDFCHITTNRLPKKKNTTRERVLGRKKNRGRERY